MSEEYFNEYQYLRLILNTTSPIIPDRTVHSGSAGILSDGMPVTASRVRLSFFVAARGGMEHGIETGRITEAEKIEIYRRFNDKLINDIAQRPRDIFAANGTTRAIKITADDITWATAQIEEFLRGTDYEAKTS